MAAKRPREDELGERIVDIDVSDEMEASFLEYAYSVIYARALPDARDGLKPVQRRILYSMHDMGIRPDKSHVKCARVVGQVMGLLHPHGDSAIYDALVRMAQPWSMRLNLVDGHGNFGSLDSGPAAMRYTECRMAPAASAMVAGIDEDTVDWKANYDGKESEPAVLPAAFPNLLVNGATGIAVGMATNIPPHNLVEVITALRHLLKHPDADLEELQRFIPGPDLPTGGKIVGLSGIQDAYAGGRGTFKIRATARIEQVSARRRGIVITELPYNVGPEKIIEQIKNLVKNKKLKGISDVKDLTDLKQGTRLVIEVKNGINPEVLLETLYRSTKLEDSFGMNLVALVEGQPKTLSLKELLDVYLEHRISVTLRRTKYLLAQASNRLHLVAGLLTAILDIDDVIQIIRSSDDAEQARNRLIQAFDLTVEQANYILEMQLRRLTRLSQIELSKERDELESRIAELQEIVESPERLREVVGDDLAEVAKEFGNPRRTVLLASAGTPALAAQKGDLEIADDPCWVFLSATGLVARGDTAGPLAESGARANHDVIASAIRSTARSEIGVVTTKGRLLRLSVVDLPVAPVTAAPPNLTGGTVIAELLPLQPGERPLCLTTLETDSLGLALGTRDGIVKRVNPEVLAKDEWEVIRLADGDSVVGAVELTSAETQLVFVTASAQLLHFSADLVRPQGRAGGGVAGIKLAGSDRVVFFGASPATDALVVTVSGNETALPGTDAVSVKATEFSEYPSKGRATGGVRCHRFLKGESALTLAYVGPKPAVAGSESGAPIDLPPATGRRDGSGTPSFEAYFAVGTRHT